MNNLIGALSTLTQPPSDFRSEQPRSDHRLAGSVVPRGSLTAGERDEMYALLASYFMGTNRAQFESDLSEKEGVVLLRDAEGGCIRGFSTFMRIATCINEEKIVAFFSGDTIIAREYWGDTLLSRLWSQTIFAEADLIRLQSPTTRVYWFLICSGYRTWRFLPVFFREFYPNPNVPTPPDVQKILNTLGQQKFGSQFRPDSGIVRLRPATPLRPGVAEVTEQRLRDSHVAFFTRMNPGHADGDELACLTEISRSNLTRAGERMVGVRARSS
jgi:hypothetical protein